MAKLELTLTPDYVNWGVWESIREIMQNGKDADDLGYCLTIKHSKGGTLSVRNEGVTMDRRNLLLGGSTKRGDDRQRGQFGEGMKLAWACLLHNGYEVYVRSGSESWKPMITWSEKFKAELLAIQVGKIQYRNAIEVVITGVSKETWDTIKSRLLFLNKPKDSFTVGTNKHILLDEEHKGLLYCRGIFVSRLPDDYQFGYDLPVELDRDRRLADPWSLRENVRDTIMCAVNKQKISPELMLDILETHPDCGEAAVFRYETNNYASTATKEFRAGIVGAFQEKYGEGSVPVSSMGDSMEAKHHGLKGVVSPTPLREIFEAQEGSFVELKAKAASDVVTQYGAHDLSEAELDSVQWVVGLVEDVTSSFNGMNDIEIVDFIGENVLGQFRKGRILVARKILEDEKELLATVVHEVAHHFGEDGSVDHRDAIDCMFSEIVMNLSGRGKE